FVGFIAVRVYQGLDLEDEAILAAGLAAIMSVVGLILLPLSASPLDRAYVALESSRQQMRDLVEHAPDGIFIADLEGHYTDVNTAGSALLGMTREELLTKQITDVIRPEDVPRLLEDRSLMLKGGYQRSEWQLRRKDGQLVPTEISAMI